MCPDCNQYSATAITSPQQLQDLQELLSSSGIKTGVLVIKAGDLQWADVIECSLQCSACGQRFELFCETYHGAGGTFGPVDSRT